MTTAAFNPTELNPAVVTHIFEESVLPQGEHMDGEVEVEGITHTARFNPDVLERRKSFLEAMLEELPDTFMASKGGGWSFLEACVDRHGNQWTGLHPIMEQLFMLGLAIGKVECQIPRHLWEVLPGGMPYYVVK